MVMLSTLTASDFALDMVKSPRWGWCPAGGYEYASTPCKVERGVFGMDEIFIARRRNTAGRYEYAAIIVSANLRTVYSPNGDRAVVSGLPMHDRDAVGAVAKWGTRSAVVAYLSTF